jgi:hemolysin III
VAHVTVSSVHLPVLERPLWRGKMHAWAFFAAIPAGLALIIAADGPAATAAAAIYVTSVLAVFGTSAGYHRLAQSARAREVMQRLDHSMIYLLIAGTYVPFCLVALPPEWGIPLLAVVGGLAVVGVVLKMALFHRARYVSYALYLVMGWAAIVGAPALFMHLTPLQLSLMVAGGVAYTVGFPVLVRRRPDPWPMVFGYHEVWHLLVVIAAVLHFGAVTAVVV